MSCKWRGLIIHPAGETPGNSHPSLVWTAAIIIQAVKELGIWSALLPQVDLFLTGNYCIISIAELDFWAGFFNGHDLRKSNLFLTVRIIFIAELCFWAGFFSAHDLRKSNLFLIECRMRHYLFFDTPHL